MLRQEARPKRSAGHVALGKVKRAGADGHEEGGRADASVAEGVVGQIAVLVEHLHELAHLR